MANTNIQSLTKDFIAVRISTTDSSSKIKDSTSDSFSSQLDKTSKQNFKTNEKQADTAVKSDLDTEVKKNQNIGKKQKDLKDKAVAEGEAANIDNCSEMVAADVVKELKKQIADRLDMSVEELESLMGSMNLGDMDLFNSEKLGMIVLEANSLTQMQDLLFDKTAANEFKSIMALLDEAVTKLQQSDIQITEDGFLDMTTGESIQVSNADEQLYSEEDIAVKSERDVPEDILKAGAADVEDLKLTDKVTEENKEDFSEEKILSEKTIQTDMQTQGNESAKQDTPNNGKGHRENNARVNDNIINDANVRFNPIEEIQEELADRVGRSQADNIMSQLMEQIKFSVNDEFKSMEMQLYPEHLGKVGIQVAIKTGILTAQITAENETVKKAIEAQLINLRESFNNQGLKVENVEVTIASHSFEENNMHNQEGQSDQGRSKRNRRLNSALVDELNGIGDEQPEDAVMETLGNTVSYTA